MRRKRIDELDIAVQAGLNQADRRQIQKLQQGFMKLFMQGAISMNMSTPRTLPERRPDAFDSNAL